MSLIHGQDGHVTTRGTGASPVSLIHGQDGHATMRGTGVSPVSLIHGQDSHATMRGTGVSPMSARRTPEGVSAARQSSPPRTGTTGRP